MHEMRMIAVLIGAMVAPIAASAQTRDTATVDATATLAAAPPVLSVEGAGNIRFGRIGAPTGDTKVCSYRLTHRANRVVLADGVVNYGDQCAFQEENQSVGIVLVKCQPGNSIGYAYSVESPVASRGVSFSIEAEDIGYETDEQGRADVLICRDRQNALIVGGRVDVDRSFTGPDAPLLVGRVTIDIFYEVNPCQCG